MSQLIDNLVKNASLLNKRIVLTEGEDERVVKAAADITARKIARVVLLGDEKEIAAKNPQVDLTGVEVISPVTSPKLKEYANLLYELRKAKGMTEEQALETAKESTYFGTLMLKAGDVDGLVSGACHSTANTLRPGLQIIKTPAGVPLVSSFFLMIAPECGNQYCKDGAFVFSDCGLEPNPDPDKLAYIAVAAAKSAKTLAGIEPNVAMLSFSTKGSAKHPDVEKVAQAVQKAKELAPDLNVDGELQFDASIVPSVAAKKAPNSPVAGKANVLIFPDLDAGNIGYKIAERLGGFTAVGPLCQGFAKPMNDLSRGCKSEDIVLAVAMTALQTQIKW